MQLLNKVIRFLNKPFPQEESSLESLKVISIVSLFVMFFLYTFEPFDLDEVRDNLFWVCFGFGAMTFLASVIYEFIVVKVFKVKSEDRHFTFGKWILYIIGVILSISLANFLFVRLHFFGDIRWEFFPYMIRSTFAIGVFPVVVLGALALLRLEKKYQDIALEINQHNQKNPNNTSTKDLFIFDIPISQIRYVAALQNYVQIGYIGADEQLTERTERTTLKNILEETAGSPLVKCHRSYIVNQNAITSTSGNAQGLLLTLADCDKEIPVSRSYVSVFRKS